MFILETFKFACKAKANDLYGIPPDHQQAELDFLTCKVSEVGINAA